MKFFLMVVSKVLALMLLMGVVIILCLLMANTVLKLSKYKKQPIEWNWATNDSDTTSTHVSDWKLVWTPRPYNTSIWTNNEWSFKMETAEYGVRRVPGSGKKIVLLVGDSFTWSNTNNEETVGAYLQALLNKEREEYTVINAGVSGYGFSQTYLRALELSRIYSPEIIIWNINQNDIEDERLRSQFFLFGNKLVYVPGFFSGIYLQNVLANLPGDSDIENFLRVKISNFDLVTTLEGKSEEIVYKKASIMLKKMAKKSKNFYITQTPFQLFFTSGFEKTEWAQLLVKKIDSLSSGYNYVDTNYAFKSLLYSPLNEQELRILGDTTEDPVTNLFLDEPQTLFGYRHPKPKGNYLYASAIYDELLHGGVL